jgi:cytoskeletal protein RodZ
MERNMYNENSFEQNLKKKADAYRMYPSDKVWESIHRHLHTRPAGLSWGAVSLFLLFFMGTCLWISTHQSIQLPSSAQLVSETPTRRTSFEEQKVAAVIPEKINKTVKYAITTPDLHTAVETITEANTSELNTILAEPKPVEDNAAVASITMLKDHTSTISSLEPAIGNSPFYTVASLQAVTPAESHSTEPEGGHIAEASQTDANINYEVAVPVYIKTKPRKELQFYITPSASYRVLYVDNKLSIGNLRLNPESVVSHQVATGWEAGVALLTPLSNRLRFKSGLQANYTRYKVNASQSVPEITTVTLTSFARIQRLSTLRNSNGAFPRNLENKTLQISIPIGLEYRMLGTNKLSFNLAATLQPSYTINATGYMVTTDYRNYIKAPDLLRRLNVNSGLETFVRFKTGSIDIQAGPQLRYQLFSNTEGKYPIQEHLIDYGFKLGIIKSLK